MSIHCYVGATNPRQPHLVNARFVLFDGHPNAALPTLAVIWAGHAHYDTQTLVTTILADDWAYLDPDITATTPGFAGQPPVPGVGMTLAATTDGTAGPEPITVFPLRQAQHLDVDWIYLIDSATATIAVHTDDGSRTARYPPTAFLPPPAAGNRLPQHDRPYVAGAPR
ncbi:hypothetical protein ACGFIR_09515 [Micromonospora sp. NPDC049051]|uniref:hypothetical protein n=1 Tax=Micromonospora sp. NPDC049051 TaxID=3364264 RepID=UPI003710B51D